MTRSESDRPRRRPRPLTRSTPRGPAVGTFELEVTDMAIDGDALGRVGGYVVLVEGAIPGERVLVRSVSAARKFARAELIRVIRPSPHRVTPRCRHFGPCGGCAWQHIAYPEQLRLKQQMLASLLENALRDDAPPVRPMLGIGAGAGGEAPWGFRNKVHFAIGRGPGGGLIMGHYHRGSRDLFDALECPVHAEAGNRIAFRARDALRRHGVEGAEANGTRGVARHVVVRVAERSGETLETLVAARSGSKGLAAAARVITSGEDAPGGLHLNIHPKPGPYIFGRETLKLHGKARLREEVAGTSFLLSPTSFFQTSVRSAEVLVRSVLENVPASERGPILDLYAGAGLFSISLARRGHRVIAVEENPAAVADGIASLRLNGLARGACRFVRARVEDALRDLVSGAEDSGRPGVVILDPPRDGCPPEAWSRLLGSLRPRRIIYVSCNPRALAGDIALAVARGYRAEAVTPVDMFPHTAHIEAIAVLGLREAPSKRGPARPVSSTRFR